MTLTRELIERLGGIDRAEEAARWACWRVGDLSWNLHDRQLQDAAHVRAAFDRGIRLHVRLCGRRYGKTRGMVTDAFEHCLSTPGARVPYAALTEVSCREFVFPEADALIATAPPELRPERVGHEIRFKNAARIIVYGCEDEGKADRLRGPRATRAYVDEAGFIDILFYVVNSVLNFQLLTTGGMMLLGCSPPKSAGHPFVKYVNDARAQDALVFARTIDAPHIAPADVETLKKQLGGEDSIDWRREALCEILTDPTRAVIPEWTDVKKTVVVEEWERPPFALWFLAADLGYVDLTVVLALFYDFKKATLVCWDERVLVRPTSRDVQAAAEDLEREHGFDPVKRTADAPYIVLADLRTLQPVPRDADGNPLPPRMNEKGQPEEERYWHVPGKDDLKAQVNNVRVCMREGSLRILKRCVTTIAHCETAIWNKQGTKFERSSLERKVTADSSQVEQTGHFDALAALIYGNREADKLTNPWPDKLAVVEDRHVPASEASSGSIRPRRRRL